MISARSNNYMHNFWRGNKYMSILQYLVEHYQYFTSCKGRCNIRLCQLWMTGPGRRAQKAATNKIMCGEFEHCYKGKLLFIAGWEDRGCLWPQCQEKGKISFCVSLAIWPAPFWQRPNSDHFLRMGKWMI